MGGGRVAGVCCRASDRPPEKAAAQEKDSKRGHAQAADQQDQREQDEEQEARERVAHLRLARRSYEARNAWGR